MPALIGCDTGTLDPNFEFLDRKGGIDSDLIVGGLLWAASRDAASESGEGSIQRRTWPHRLRCLGLVWQIITAGLHWLALRGDQLSINLGRVGRQRLRQRF